MNYGITRYLIVVSFGEVCVYQGWHKIKSNSGGIFMSIKHVKIG